ncbi:MAG TPA: LysR family transcriptional regulator [Bdellovibrionota bacterium]|jgi:DNA-binding transcriptional LysR family regulator|nr:LysR family transcriptional regulator [Bdellovibrionota bacterium]
MELSTANLNAFYILAQERNFSRAARRLALSQPAFSQRIMNLERELETTLVVRDKKNLGLTPDGERLLRYCEVNRQIEEEFLHELKATRGTELRGSLRIGGFSSVMRSLLVPALAPLLRKHAGLSLQTFTAELRDVIPLLRESRADFVLHNRPAEHESLESVLLGYEENVLVSSKRYSDTETYLDHDENDPTTTAYFALSKSKAQARKRYLDDVYGLLDGVKLGLGKAVLPRHLVDERELKIESPSRVLRVPVHLVYRRGPYYTQVQKLAIEAITEHFRGHLSQRAP